MCDGSADGPSCSTNTFRRARKDHLCCACGERIDPGHRYHFTSGIWDGYAYSFKHCLRCWTMFEFLVQENYPDLVDLDLNCGESYEDIFGKAPPEGIQALAFISGADMQEETT